MRELQSLSPLLDLDDLGLSTGSHCLQHPHVQTGNLGGGQSNAPVLPLLKPGTK